MELFPHRFELGGKAQFAAERAKREAEMRAMVFGDAGKGAPGGIERGGLLKPRIRSRRAHSEI